MIKKGDTLIEVTLAVGIFSMIAVAVTAVLSSSTSGAQTALETTLAREEVDTQAEALRFIQTSYAVDRNDTENNKFYQLWHEITKNAIDMDEWTEDRQQAILQYQPDNCSDLYSSENQDNEYSDIRLHAFIVNPRALGTFTANDLDSVYTPFSSGKLTETSIYPRLVFGKNAIEAENDTQSLFSTNDNLYRAEGIYVLAVADHDTTVTKESFTNTTSQTPAFYDFYIRTCWYGTDANRPSTISTVIRLHNPDAI